MTGTWFLVADNSGLTGRKGTLCRSVISVLWFCVDNQTEMQKTDDQQIHNYGKSRSRKSAQIMPNTKLPLLASFLLSSFDHIFLVTSIGSDCILWPDFFLYFSSNLPLELAIHTSVVLSPIHFVINVRSQLFKQVIGQLQKYNNQSNVSLE